MFTGNISGLAWGLVYRRAAVITKAASAAIIGLLLTAQGLHAQQDYTITDLGTLGGASSQAADINSNGQVVGYSTTFTGETHAFLWENGTMNDLGTLGGTYSNAVDINDAGQVVGMSTTVEGKMDAFIWQDGVMTNLGDMGGQYSKAVRVNEAGQVTGMFIDSNGMQYGFVWQDGVMKSLGTIPGDSSYNPVDINNNGSIAVLSASNSSIWSADTFSVLPTLSGASGSFIRKINKDGKAAGYNASYSPVYWSSAVLWDNGTVTDLGNLGTNNSTAYDLNDSGVVVGTTTDANGSQHGFSWKDGVMTDLGTGVIPLHISSGGAIAGHVNIPGQYYTGMEIDNGDLTLLKGIDGNLNTRVYALNDSRQVVGSSRTTANALHATLWELPKPRFTLSVSSTPLEGGTVDAYPFSVDGTYESGTVVTLTANAENGYAFTGWSGDASGTDTETNMTVDADKSVTAGFTKLYTLTASVNVSGAGSVAVNPESADGTYLDGTVVGLTATAADGYVFTGWSGDATGADLSAGVTMDTDRSITANFEPAANNSADPSTSSGSFSTGFCGKTMKGNKKVPIHVVLEGGNPDDVPTVIITYPDGQVLAEPMVKLGKGQDAWRYDLFKFSADMPAGVYTVEVTRGGSPLDLPLSCSFTYAPATKKSK